MRCLLGALTAAAIWALTFLPLGSPLTPWRYLGVGAFFLTWLYCAVATVQLLHALVKLWRESRASKT